MSEMEITIALIVIVVILLIYKLKQQRYTKEGVPIVGNIPWLGCGIQLRRGGGKFIREMREKYGDVFQLRAGGKEFNFVFHEDFLSRFYKGGEQDMGFYEGIKDDSSQFHFDIILGPKLKETAEEKKEVSAIKPIKTFLQIASGKFTEEWLNPHYNFFLSHSLKMQKIDSAAKKFTIEVHDLCLHIVMGLGASGLAGFPVASDPRFLKEVKNLCVGTFEVLTRPRILSKQFVKKCHVARDLMRTVIDEAIDNQTITGLGEVLRNSCYESTGRQFGKEEVSYSTFAMIFATMSNTSAALTNALIDILAFPEVKEKVMEELMEVVVKDERNKNVNDANYYFDQEMVNKLEYMQCCVTETLRLYSPAAHIRKMQVDLLNDEGKILVPKGSFVCVSPWNRHRDENMFENPDLYDPSRFAKNVKQKRFSFLPFGHGRHHCLGKHFAESITKLTIARLLLQYDMKLIKDETSSRNANPKISWFGFGVLKPSVPVYCQLTSKY